ncbi:solute carrier family 49 member 4-like [Oratosquilla oratoria]|uniref:solute carrier family 49 member 4-like n=1 Tax=Oratosquilla oratoria TaxID=337810 RepID=UPI003F767E07
MLKNCSVHGCFNSKSRTKDTEVRYYGFPKERKFREAWIRACRREDKVHPDHALICSIHFSEDDFVDGMTYRLLGVGGSKDQRTLKKEAVPSQFLPKDLERRPLLGSSSESLPSNYSSGRGGDSEALPLTTATYKTRFWNLAIFSLLGLFQCWQWNTWGPISESALEVFPDWDASTIATMANAGTIAFVLAVFPVVWLVQQTGLRVGVLLGISLTVVGTVLRVACFNTAAFKWASYTCGFLIGISACVILAVPSMLAASWFPPRERTTATATAQGLNFLGGCVSYISPSFVSSPGGVTSDEVIKGQIHLLLYIHMGASLVLFLAALAYFPERPPLPPSVSSTAERLDFVESFRRLRRRSSVWLLLFVYGISFGVSTAMIPVLNLLLCSIGVLQTEAMFLGQLSILILAVVTVGVGHLTDHLYGHIKLTIFIMLLTASGAYFWFYLISAQAISVELGQVYSSVIIGFSLTHSTNPLFYELAAELAFPCPEVVVGGLLGTVRNLVCIVILMFFFVPDIGYMWFTLVLMGSTSLSLVPFAYVKEDYRRSILDRVSPVP